MIDSNSVRQSFLDFFKSKSHQIVDSAPMVVKNDPTLMFTNAGMNQFKDIFLGNSKPTHTRIADTQKCLRVSGKHNDLEEVGLDTYHHTMFEMLGNWSFGDYFKKEAIAWAWEFLTQVQNLDKNRLYVTIFGGDPSESLDRDMEAFNYWKEFISEDRILNGSKKDNFWEMGDTGPCGPCSEIHIDLRDDAERTKSPGRELVNTGDPQVVEIWNLVFIQYNRTADGSLKQLPQKHVDTGMGFERLCMALQGKKSNYDTDIFQDIFREIEKISGFKYGQNEKQDIAMRVIADHLRAVSFAIADGQLPSNNKAGYVIRRILRRAVRYGYTFLNLKEPFINLLVPALVAKMGNTFKELKAQETLIKKVITEEEQAFLKTLETGIAKFEHYITEHNQNKTIDGKFAFELLDTYGFPIDLTELMARENGWTLDREGFESNMLEQKERSRQDAQISAEDWVELKSGEAKTEFLGWDTLDAEVNIIKYRKINKKGKDLFQLVFDKSPFYAESGGQTGDRGHIEANGETIIIEDTQKENELIIHIASKLPKQTNSTFKAFVNKDLRHSTMRNHSATHLLHAALRKVLGTHVEQKGSMVDENRLRFDFSHFTRMTDEEIRQVEIIVNEKIRQNIQQQEYRKLPMKEAQTMGAMALFGEKYGDEVRVICFEKDYSVELCGGTHVSATGEIGLLKITSESAIAAGVRRIEAITGKQAEELMYQNTDELNNIRALLKNTKDIEKSLKALLDENAQLQKQIEQSNREKAGELGETLKKQIKTINGINFIGEKVALDMAAIKDLAFSLKKDVENLFLIIGNQIDDKANITLMISENLVEEKKLNAGVLIRDLAKEIQGGGGGQPFFATAGGKNPQGIDNAIKKAETIISSLN